MFVSHLILLTCITCIITVQPKPMHSLVKDIYHLDTSTLSSNKRPTYSRHPPVHLDRRDSTGQFIGTETKSFAIYLTCSNSTLDTCQTILYHLARAAKRIESVVYLPVQIRINATFGPLCTDGVSNCDSSSVLGQASPSSWIVWGDNDTIPETVDRKYSYPSALVRQLIPNDPSMNNSLSDISASFNSNYNWWLSGNGSDSLGMAQDGEFGPIQRDFNAQSKSFDFEQVRFICFSVLVQRKK